MPLPRPRTLLLLVALVANPTRAQTPAPSHADVRKSVQASLPFIERYATNWIKQKDCMSCHTVPFMLWTFNLAKSRGIPIDDAKLADWINWSLHKSLDGRGPFKLTKTALDQLKSDGLPDPALTALQPLLDKNFPTEQALLAALDQAPASDSLKPHRAAIELRAATPKGGDGGSLDTMSQLLLARGTYGSDGAWPQFLATTPAFMLSTQQPDGHWKCGGQLPSQKRPKDESDAVTTRWAALALGTIDKPDAVTAQHLIQALQSAAKSKGATTEYVITGLLIDRRFGKGEDPAPLLKMQNPDGGWAWLGAGPSDAYATGQALFALAAAPTPGTQPNIDRARRYLLDTQQPDGAWPTTGQGISNAATDARKKKVETIYHFWGTAWAAIGLTTSLPITDTAKQAKN